VVEKIAVGKRPRGIHLSRDGKELLVALSGSPIGGPGVDESKLPPPDRTADGIGIVDIAARKIASILTSGPDPEQIALSPDGTKLFVSNE
jgi:DNA-binding beta-propeller fold protein YncE